MATNYLWIGGVQPGGRWIGAIQLNNAGGGGSSAPGYGTATGVASGVGVGSSTVAASGSGTGLATAAGVGASLVSAFGAGTGLASGVGVSSAAASASGSALGLASGSGTASSLVSAFGAATGAASGLGISSALVSASGSAVGLASGVVQASSLVAAFGAGTTSALGAGAGASLVSASGTATASASGSGVGASLVSAFGQALGLSSGSGLAASVSAGFGAAVATASGVGQGASQIRAFGSAVSVASGFGIGLPGGGSSAAAFYFRAYVLARGDAVFQIAAGEQNPTYRIVFFKLVATDGITPATGEVGGQPQLSINGGAWTNTGISALANPAGVGGANSNGLYNATLDASVVLNPKDRIETRYKSSGTAECPGDSVVIVPPATAPSPAAVTSPTVVGSISITAGDTYLAALGNAINIPDTANNWPDLSAASGAVLYAPNYKSASALALSVIVPSGPGKLLRLELTSTQSAALAQFPGQRPWALEVQVGSSSFRLGTIPVTVSL